MMTFDGAPAASGYKLVCKTARGEVTYTFPNRAWAVQWAAFVNGEPLPLSPRRSSYVLWSQETDRLFPQCPA